MDQATRDQLIAKYKDGYRQVSTALNGASAKELAVKPAPGKWSAVDVVHHLADSEMTAAIRLRRLLAENNPRIEAYDQDRFAGALYYDRPLDASLQAFRYARESTAEILSRMTDAQWQRKGTHSETGAYGVEKWLETHAKHAANHADQIRRALESARQK